MSELLPCPFCGSEPRRRMIHSDGDDREPPYLAACCEAHTDWITVEQWNRRRQSQESVREETVLDAPAQIGSTRFHAGVKWSAVIDRAQREWRYRNTPDPALTQMKDALTKAENQFDALQHALARVAEVADGGICPRCKGSGDVKGMTQGHGPDDYEVDVECPDCKGTGESPAKEQPGEVAAMVKRLRSLGEQITNPEFTGWHVSPDGDGLLLLEAAALIEKLGHGWVPVSSGKRPEAYPFVIRWNDETEKHVCDRYEVINDANDERPLPEGIDWTCATHWMPLPPPPERP